MGSAYCLACGASLVATGFAHTLPVGTALRAGTYTLGNVLGEGGFGITYKAHHHLLKRAIAIKELFPEGAQRVGTAVSLPPSQQQAFQNLQAAVLQEAQHVAQLPSDHIVDVYDVFHENGTVYIVMEYLSGQTLEERVAHTGPVSPTEVQRIARDICVALEQVHARSLVHRDIKPANIMLTATGKAVLIDFGSARAFLAGQTVAHTQMLTPAYAAPEQYSSQARFGPPTDIFSLGATLYFALTGAPPDNVWMRLQQAQAQTVGFPPGLTGPLVAAVQQALELKIADRPPTIKVFRQILDGTRSGGPTRSTATTSLSPGPTPPRRVWGRSRIRPLYRLRSRPGSGNGASSGYPYPCC